MNANDDEEDWSFATKLKGAHRAAFTVVLPTGAHPHSYLIPCLIPWLFPMPAGVSTSRAPGDSGRLPRLPAVEPPTPTPKFAASSGPSFAASRSTAKPVGKEHSGLAQFLDTDEDTAWGEFNIAAGSQPKQARSSTPDLLVSGSMGCPASALPQAGCEPAHRGLVVLDL